jgi:LacI family transcriptional regulator
MAKKRTIEDIARLAGVSTTTVSRVLNHRPDVDPETRKRVLQIIAQEGYVPNTAASGLASGRSRLIGMLIPSWTWPLLLIPDLIRGITEVIKQTPYDLVLYSINEEDLERDRTEVITRLLASQLTAGLLAVFPAQVSQHLTHLYQQGFPVVIIDDQQKQITPLISADNVNGAYMAVRHLVNLGHRRIAHIQGPHEYLVSHDRHRGYCQALQEAGITPDPAFIVEGDFLPGSGHACASKFFELPLEQRPTAIFASSDEMAYGVLTAAEEYGLSVPQDVALVGFDDDPPSAHTRPALTTVRQPFFEMGQQGIKLLLSMVATPQINIHSQWTSSMAGILSEVAGAEAISSQQPVHLQFPTTLVVRASCGVDHHVTVSTSSG